MAHADGLDEVEARLRVTEAGIDVLAGRHDEARVILSTIAARTGGRAVTEALSQLGVLHLLAGDYRSAIECLDGAIGVLGVEGIWAANAWSNRGLARAYMGDLATAEHDLAQAIEVFGELGSRQAVAEVRQNLGWVRDQAGDYVGALESFTAADMVLADTPASRGYLLRDRANTLMAVGLVVDAVEDAAASVAAFESAGRDGDAAESRIVEASALILLDDRVRATEVAEQARASFVAQGRPIYADHAHLISLRAATPADATEARASEARRLASSLERRGTVNVALDARLAAARLSMWCGDIDAAQYDLESAGGCRRSPRHDLRVSYWELAAELSAKKGERTEALRACRSGFEVLDESQRTLGSTEARVNISATARRLGAVALEIAVDRGPANLFDWMERVRAGALRYRPVRPRGDHDLVAARAALRSIAKEIEDAQMDGRDVSELLNRRAETERSLRLRLLEARGEDLGAARVSAADVRSMLHDSVLVAYAGIEGRLVAVRIDGRRSRLIELGPIEEITNELDHLRFALLRLVSGRASESSIALIRAGAERLDELLLRPVDRGDLSLVIVPMGAMFTVPWALLPAASERPISLAPSATMWATAASRVASRGGHVLAAGPELAHARAEVATLAQVYRDATILDGERASAARLLRAIDGAGLFHIASHGVFRADNPLFSHLRVSDGPLAVHELEMLGRAPETVVLSSCDVGLTQPRPGNEWLGMATALLSLGTRSLVASVGLVPDTEATVELMSDMHRRISTGVAPAEALHAATLGLTHDDPVHVAARAAFVCMGA